MHTEELHHLYSLPNSIQVINKKNEMGWACGAYGGEERGKKGLVGKP
jgi:hypothetical protein